MLHNKGGIDYAGNRYWYFHPLQTVRIYKAQRKAQGWITNGLLNFPFFSPHLWPSELQSLVPHNKWDFQNMDSYHQVSITSSNTQPSVSISFNKELHINRHPLKPKTIKTFHSWWMLSKFRENKAYLQTQYEHGMNTAINSKAANVLFSPLCRHSENSKNTRAGEKIHTLPNLTVGHDSFQSNIGVKVSSSGDHQPQFLSEPPRGSSSPLPASLRKMQCPPVFQSLSCRRCCSEKEKRRRCGIKF